MELLSDISIPNEGTANLYRELLPYLRNSSLQYDIATKLINILRTFDENLKRMQSMGGQYTKSNGFVEKNKNILFLDFNGVLSHNLFWASLSSPSHPLHKYHEQIEAYLFRDNGSIVRDWMLGVYTSEGIHKLLEEKIGVPYEELFPVFQEDCANIDISMKILEKVKELRKFYHCTLITDNMDSFDRFTLPSNPQLYNAFDDIDNSSSMGQFKKTDDGKYFIDKIKKQKAIIANCILIDDSSNNCTLFESLGGKAFLVKTEEQTLATLETILNAIHCKWEWQY